MDTPVQPSTPPPVPPASPTPKNKSNKKVLMVIIAGIILAILGVAVGYALDKNVNKPVTNTTQPSPTSLPTPTPYTTESLDQTTSIPPGWSYSKSTACNLSIPIPPAEEPYAISENDANASELDKGGAWKFEENNKGEPMFPNVAQAFYFKANLPPGDYIAGNVNVSCAPNTQNYTTTTLYAAFEKDFNSKATGLTLKKVEDTTMWDREVVKFRVEGGMFAEGLDEYMLATPTHIYRIFAYSASTSPSIKGATQTILAELLIGDE